MAARSRGNERWKREAALSSSSRTLRSREVTALLAVALLLLIVVALLLGGTTPARAEGLDFGCREGTPAELGLAARLEKEYPKFKAELPDPELPIGVRPEPTLLTVEVTGTDDQGAPWPFTHPTVRRRRRTRMSSP